MKFTVAPLSIRHQKDPWRALTSMMRWLEFGLATYNNSMSAVVLFSKLSLSLLTSAKGIILFVIVDIIRRGGGSITTAAQLFPQWNRCCCWDGSDNFVICGLRLRSICRAPFSGDVHVLL